MSKLLLSFVFSAMLLSAYAQFQPHAGVIPSFTEGATASQPGNGSNLNHIIDNNDQTQSQSDAPLPLSYISRPDQNIMLGHIGQWGISSGTNDLTDLSDGNVNTAVGIPVSAGVAWLAVQLPAASPFKTLSIKLTQITADVQVYIFTSPTDSILIGTYQATQIYQTLRYSYQANSIVMVKLQSVNSFTLSELAMMANPPKEYVVVDLGSNRNIGWIYTRHWAGTGNATATELFLSQDNVNWTKIADLDPSALRSVATAVSPAQQARYIKLQHTLVEQDWRKVFFWEIDAYDQYGEYGPMPGASPQTIKLSEQLGVNGIWGWGHNAYSTAIPAGQGSALFNRAVSNARNYHSLNWDILDPDISPDYVTMAAGGGTPAQWWLNWDQEYQAWQNNGLNTHVSLMFESFDTTDWNDPYTSAYNIGYAFARHFGPSFGTGHITALEVGNEPWSYPAGLYKDILRGMSNGAKAADPNFLVLPGAMQARDPYAEQAGTGNYAGTRLEPADMASVDALNSHHYSYLNNSQGERIAVHPEHPYSSFRGILNDIRFRDVNYPNLPIYCTEWGWDSEGGGQNCAFNECVSEAAQALYAVRSAMILSRLGIEKFYWFFYSNTQDETLYGRSGLTGNNSSNFQLKRSFVAFEALNHVAGDYYFSGVIQEDSNAYVYILGDTPGDTSLLVAWKPVDANDNSSHAVQVALPQLPTEAWQIAGLNALGESIATPTKSNGQIQLNLTTTPVFVKLGPDTLQTATTSLANGDLTTIWPNPIMAESQQLHIEGQGAANLKVYSMNGALLFGAGVTLPQAVKLDLGPGLYLLQVIESTGTNYGVYKLLVR